MYYEYEEAIQKIVPHRILAINRGEKEDVLKVSINPPADRIITLMKNKWMKQARLTGEVVACNCLQLPQRPLHRSDVPASSIYFSSM